MQQKTVLYLVPSAAIGGAETFIKHTCRFHDVEKVNPYYLFFRKGPLLSWMQENYPNRVLTLPKPPRLSRIFSFISAIRQIRRLIRSQKVTIVHSTMAYSAIFGAVATWGTNARHVWFQHGPVCSWMDTLAGLLPANLMFFNSLPTLDQQVRREIPWNFFRFRTRQERLIVLGVDKIEPGPALADRSSVSMFSRIDEFKGIILF